MKEKLLLEQLKDKPTLEELDNVSGREIAGIEPRPEKFMKLSEGEDYEVLERNENIKSERPLSDFFVFISPSAGTEIKTVEAPHWRVISDNDIHSSIDLPSSSGSSEDRTEHFYSVNTKGAGYLKVTAKGFNIEDYDTWTIENEDSIEDNGYRVLGFVSSGENSRGNIMEKSEELVKEGLRSELYWAVAKIKRLPYKGDMLSVGELRKKEIISPREDYEPNQAVRLLKLNNRIAEAAESDPVRSRELFARAFHVFNRETMDSGLKFPELSIGDPELERIFFEEFFNRMGHNMATLLNLGYAHGAMHSANVTLAAELGDIGTIGHWSEEEDAAKGNKKYGGVRRESLKDMRDMCYGLRMLIKAAKKAGLNSGDRNSLRTAFFKGFDEIFDSNKINSEETDAGNAHLWMEKILDTVIIDGGNLPPLLHNEVEDWDISIP